MDVIENFSEEEHKNWLKGVFMLICAQKPLEMFVAKEMEDFCGKLRNVCGAAPCERDCRSVTKDSPLCEVCSSWKKEIKEHHNNPPRVFWRNCTPCLWSKDTWEVAKAYMPSGHEKHKLLGDFDVPALLRIMNNCKHFNAFQISHLNDLVKRVSYARNDLMHSASFKVEKKDLCDYAERIRELGRVLAEHDPVFGDLSQDIDQILNRDFTVKLLDGQAEEEIQARHQKELEMLQQSHKDTIQSLRVTQASYRSIIMKQRKMIKHLRKFSRESNFLFCIITVFFVSLLLLFFFWKIQK